MTTAEAPAAIDLEKLEAFVFRAVDEVGATLNAALVVMGDKLGLYKAMAGAGPLEPAEIARRADVSRALRARMAERAGCGRLRRVRPGERPLHAAARAGDGTHRRDQPGVPGRLLPDRGRLGARLAAHHRGRPDRGGHRLARPRARRARRAASGSSGPATTRTSSRRGSPRSTASSRSSSRARRWPTSAAATAPRPS